MAQHKLHALAKNLQCATYHVVSKTLAIEWPRRGHRTLRSL